MLMQSVAIITQHYNVHCRGKFTFLQEAKRQTPCKMIEFEGEQLSIPPIKYEYLDHTADVQLHAWGENMKEAFEQCGMAMFGYMTELDTVELKKTAEFEIGGSDMENLLFHFLDELLYLFYDQNCMVCKKVEITEMIMDESKEEYNIKCKCWGEEFVLGKHPQGTEVKAITYSAMQVINNEDLKRCEVFVVIDI